jgi:uncharacterized Ntn-hydrolase superfamily protein
MKKILLLVFPLFFQALHAQDTFSIVAVDSLTGEVGSAGASCVNLSSFGLSADFLGDLLPGKGAINTQSYYNPSNQQNARLKMTEGLSLQDIVTWLSNNDAQNDASLRQYGIAGFVNGVPMAESFTGDNCMDVKYHKTGRSSTFAYAIQGNILNSTAIIDSMEARFKREPGDLKHKLMASMQGANVIGADSRCQTYNTSSLFAFLKVSAANDPDGSPSFNIGVIANTTNPFEPIDSLQVLFDLETEVSIHNEKEKAVAIFPNPVHDILKIESPERAVNFVMVFDVFGKEIYKGSSGNEFNINCALWNSGIYFVQIHYSGGKTEMKKVIKL